LITRALDVHNVGQYYFVNFPGLSLTEWHPFSVSSGPREESIELHIRALGDHTTRVVEYAKENAKLKILPWIRVDGPYGKQNFDYKK
jgi:respiratory burst oxidase